MKNAGMAGAVALVGIGLITIGLSNFASRADAVPASMRGAGLEDPVIVAFGSLGMGSAAPFNTWGESESGFYRLWSDGTLEVRRIRYQSAEYSFCNGDLLIARDCGSGTFRAVDTGWVPLPAPPGGDDFACRADINRDRAVDAEDLGLLLTQWGAEGGCGPQPTYPCFDLGGLNMNLAAR